jgi:hypothetical protein
MQNGNSLLPLLVHLVFHADSVEARELAVAVHRSLNDDPLVPGLDIPTTFCNVSTHSPPADQELDRAERSFVVVLADDYLVAGENAKHWHAFVETLWQECENGPHRFVPIQLSKSAWGFSEELTQACVSFGRVFHESDPARRATLVCRSVATELARFLLNESMGSGKTAAPFKLFISHAKQDLNLEPEVVNELKSTLTADQPLKAWVDSGEIPFGVSFEQKIEVGIKESSLLVVLTDNYAGREWCRREVLFAKKHQRPIVVVDALQQYEVRSFPYLGNVPVIRWVPGEPYRAIDLIVKESIRQLYTRSYLNRWCGPGDVVVVRPPELATIANAQDKTMLYPDPPLGHEELCLLDAMKVKAVTPMQRLAQQKTLPTHRVAISMSESSDIERYGFDGSHLENAIVEISRYLLIQGAGLAYGGHLGIQGFTELLFDMVRAHNQVERSSKIRPIVNYSGWPLPEPSVTQKAELKEVGEFRRVARADGIDEQLHPDFVANPEFFPATKSPLHRMAWSLGMTAMRQAQVAETSARIVLGGKTDKTLTRQPDGTSKESWYMSRIPGVLEEVYLSSLRNQPVFLIGAFGGAAAMVIDLIRGTDRIEATWDFQKAAPHSVELRELYNQQGLEWIDYPELVAELRKRGVTGINPLLTEAENLELFETIDLMRMIELVIRGLSKLIGP